MGDTIDPKILILMEPHDVFLKHNNNKFEAIYRYRVEAVLNDDIWNKFISRYPNILNNINKLKSKHQENKNISVYTDEFLTLDINSSKRSIRFESLITNGSFKSIVYLIINLGISKNEVIVYPVITEETAFVIDLSEYGLFNTSKNTWNIANFDNSEYSVEVEKICADYFSKTNPEIRKVYNKCLLVNSEYLKPEYFHAFALAIIGIIYLRDGLERNGIKTGNISNQIYQKFDHDRLFFGADTLSRLEESTRKIYISHITYRNELIDIDNNLQYKDIMTFKY